MDEPVKEIPRTSKRSRRKPAMEPLGWDEIVSQPGMGGYLSFLNGPVPLPHLQGSAPVFAPDPGVVLGCQDPVVVSDPLANTTAEAVPTPESISNPETISNRSPGDIPTPDVVLRQTEADPVVVSSPHIDIAPEALSTPNLISGASTNLYPQAATDTEVVSTSVIITAQRLRIRRCAATHDGHSLGEEVLYQALWKAALPDSSETRTIVIGWRGMSQLCRMTPKNCKINTQRLIRKLALEVLSPYNTPESIGTTYRVYSDETILHRRRAAGLDWVVRSRGVEFVDPATGISILPICAHT